MRKLPKQHKGKAKRWPKGQSSNSNPETRKFREAAKTQFFRHEPIKGSKLTVGTLKTFDALHSKTIKPKDVSMDDDFEDSATFESWASAKTFKTFASDWSECSNMSFNRLLKKFEPTSALHKEMLAVLAAVTEVIKQVGGKETTTEYFGALMTALAAAENEEAVTATLSLLAMCIKSVPDAVLRLKFSEASKTFIEILEKYCEMENAVIVRSVIGCLSVLLRAQDTQTWTYSSTRDVFHSILVFVTHSKPRIRKAAKHAICSILKGAKFKEDVHPVAQEAAKFCIQQMEKSDSQGQSTTLRLLSLLKDIIGTFPKNYIKLTSETVLKMMTLGTALITNSCLEVFYGLFTQETSKNRLTSTLNAQILNALYNYQPSSNDCQPTLAWLTVMQETFRCLSRTDPILASQNLEKFFVVASRLWLNDKMEIVKGAILALRVLAMDCLSVCPDGHIRQRIFAIVESGLKYQYFNAWAYIFNLLGVLFEVIGKEGESYMLTSIRTLSSLRESHNFAYTTELDHTIGKAIRSLGPEIVLKAIPVVITGNEPNYEVKMSWMLPLLKENVQRSNLKFYIDYFLPLAALCERKCKELNAKNEKIGAHVYELLQLQIWAILPSFCSHAKDIKENFKLIARTLGTLISDRKHLRISAMSSLRRLIAGNKDGPEENKDELCRFAKNYLPILFTLYTTQPQGSDESGERLAAFDTIQVYLTIAKSDICTELFDRALGRLEESSTDEFTMESVMDLLKLLVPLQNEGRLAIIYEKCFETLNKNDAKKEEKKAFRLLEVLIASDSESCKAFMSIKSKEIFAFMKNSLKKENLKYRGARLRCILHLIKYIPNKNYELLKSLIPEAVICCKDINQRTRTVAFRVLDELYSVYKKWSSGTEEDAFRNYINLIIGGLAGTPTLVSATVLALGKLTMNARSSIAPDVAQLMLESVCIMCALPTREIVGTCLIYLKVFLKAFPKQQLFPYIPAIVKAVISMNDDCKNHFRLKTRDIMDRLIRKFGFEPIKLLVPEEDVIMHKRLKNLNRIYKKKQAAKTESEKDEDSDEDGINFKLKSNSIDEILASSDDESEEDDTAKAEKKWKEKGKTYIEEDPDDIIDFLTPTTSGRLTATKPVIKEKKNREFEFSSDGRLIVFDDSKTKKGDDYDSDLDDLESMMSEVVIGKKRKMSVASDERQYKAGGTGIHRPTKTVKLENSKKSTKKNKSKSKKELQLLKTGKEYRAKKARGDVKLKGKPDPYAYIPLSRKLLNKRKKLKSSAQLKGVIKSALKGAKRGAKAKLKRKQK